MKRFTVFLVLATFLFTLTAFAGHQCHKKHRWWKNENTLKELSVSEAQLNEINKIDEDFNPQFEKLHKELMDQKEALRSMLNDPKSTNEQLVAKHNEKLAKKNELKKLKFEKKLKIRNVLNDEQIVKLGEIKSKRWEEHKKGCDGKECSEGCTHKNKCSGECSYKDKK